MEESFHYYATYCAAYLAGYSHEESMDICYSAQFVDLCSRTLLTKIGGPNTAATTQLQLELMDARTDKTGLQDITRIWSSFHFLPRDLKAEPPRRTSKKYKDKYRLICGPNGDLVVDTVELARGSSLQAAGVAMHVLADTWAHTNFAGTTSLVINNTGYEFYEILPENGKMVERHLTFRHSASAPDNLEKGKYTNTVFQTVENTIMNLGHGRAGHLPDYSFMRWRYMPAWGNYEEIIKDNPSDYLHAFTQMVYALRYIRGDIPAFEKETYDTETVRPWVKEIKKILVKRQLDACPDWKALGEKMSGCEVEAFDLDKYQEEFVNASHEERDETFLGKFILAATAHKSMVTNRIYSSGNKLAGISITRSKSVDGGEQ
ncbi:MAG: hypothetical protein IJI20_02505 [Firmicutes bacterium]|nr:hypothetical protein [Bacillota bacterium]